MSNRRPGTPPKKAGAMLACVALLLLPAAAALAQSSQIDVSKQAEGPDSRTLAPGDVSFSVTVRNNGAFPLAGIVVTDDTTADCGREIADLVPGEAASYTCTAYGVGEGFTGTACVEAAWDDAAAPTGCPKSAGYWKNHQESWPVSWLAIGSDTEGVIEVMEYLSYRGGNAAWKLARHLAAAMINVENGHDAAIQGVIDDANAFLTAHPVGGELSAEDAATASGLQGQLEAYNNSCEAEDCDDSTVVIGS